MPVAEAQKIPLTLVVGFLGAGKTSLVNRILAGRGTRRLAVIENELGEVGIDSQLVSANLIAKEDIVSLERGCVCCSLRSDLVEALKELERRAGASGQPFDAVLLETTGVADPGPVVFTFFANSWISSRFRLDSVCCLVDAKHISMLLDERSPDALDEVVNQIAFADTILLNKIDLVSPEDLQHARDLVRAVNVTANLIECQLKDSDVADGAIAPGAGGAAVTWDTVMDVNSFSIERALQVDPTFMDDSANKDGDHEGDDEDDEDDGEDDAEEEEEDAATTAGRDGQPGTGGPPSTRARSREATAAVRKRGRAGSRGGSASTGGGGVGVGGDSVGGGGGGDAAKRAAGALPAAQRWRRQSLHDLAGVSSVGISAAGPLDQYRFNMFMKDLLLEKARDIMRCKGVLCIAGQERTRFVFQGVHDTVCFGPSAQGWDPDAPGPPVSQIVFIGRNLDRAMLSEGFRSCVWSPLPAGWTEHLDDRSGRPYFVCPATGAKQWTRPMGDAGTGGAAGVEVTEAPLRASLEGGGKVASPPAVAGAPQA